MIRFEGASYAYRGPYGSVPAVRGVTFEVAPGESVALLGANGSGKSTIVRMANGLLAPDAGSVQVDGIDTRDETRLRELRERVGMVFQHPDEGVNQATLPFTGEEQPFELAFNIDYLTELLERLPGEEVVYQFKDEVGQGVFMSPSLEDFSFRYVLMPVRFATSATA